jgi:hypothetical protein
MPNADIWFAEYDAQCLQKHMAHLKALNVRAVSGDQGDNATLARWLEETGCTRGELFDVIIVSGRPGEVSPAARLLSLQDSECLS